MAIKGWKKDSNKPPRWVNGNQVIGETFISVLHANAKSKEATWNVVKTGKGEIPVDISKSKSKSKAIKKAKAYMRKHPNG